MIDEFLDLKSGINLVYGEAASGKTTLALMLAYNYSKFSKVIFIDTENGFNFERFKQIAKDDYEACLRNILLYKVKSFDEQYKIVKNLSNLNKIGLIILDTLGMYYRLELKNDVKDINNKVSEMLNIFISLYKKGTKILINNQVYKNFENNKLESVGGNMVKKLCKFIVKLERDPRKIIREKPGNHERLFVIKDGGIILK